MDVALSWEVAPPSFRRHTNGKICSHIIDIQSLIDGFVEKGDFDPPCQGLTALGNSVLHDTNHSSFIQRIGASQNEESNDTRQNAPAGHNTAGTVSNQANSVAEESNDVIAIVGGNLKRNRFTQRDWPEKRQAISQ